MQNALKHLSSSKEQVGQRAQSLKSALARMRGRIDLNNPGPVEEGLSRYEGFLMEDLRSLLKLLSQQSLTPPQVLQQIPPSIRARTVSPSGKILLRIYPARDCWAYPALQGFVTDLREVDPEATGTPRQGARGGRTTSPARGGRQCIRGLHGRHRPQSDRKIKRTRAINDSHARRNIMWREFGAVKLKYYNLPEAGGTYDAGIVFT